MVARRTFKQLDANAIFVVWILRIGAGNRSSKWRIKHTLIDCRCLFRQLWSDNIHQTLDKVALPHQQEKSDRVAMIFELVFFKHNFQQLLWSNWVSVINPIFEIGESVCCIWSRNVLDLKWHLERDVQYPVLLATATTDEVDSFTCQKNFVGNFIRKERWDHDIIQAVFMRPKTVVVNFVIYFNKEFFVRIDKFAFQHPRLDHCENRCGNFSHDAWDELVCCRRAIQNISVECWANGTTFQPCWGVDNDRKPFESLHGLLHPQVQFAQI